MSEVEGERGRGRPRMNWMVGVKKYVSENGMTWVDVQLMTGERTEWRNFFVATPCGNKASGKGRGKIEKIS